MTVLACPHCGDIIEIRGDVKKRQCDCGGEMEEIEDPMKAFGAIFPEKTAQARKALYADSVTGEEP
jgi:hypothetical protein